MNVNEYKTKNNTLPKSITEPNLMSKLSIDTDNLNCCIDYKFFNYKIVKIQEEKGYHYEKKPGESFALVIKPENYFRYFIYNEDEKVFEMRE